MDRTKQYDFLSLNSLLKQNINFDSLELMLISANHVKNSILFDETRNLHLENNKLLCELLNNKISYIKSLH